jgi:enoyl-CoA hydratase/carnithine racemase
VSGEPEGIGQEVLFDIVDGNIAVVTLNRPKASNAVNAILTQALDFLVKRIETDDAIRVAILASSGDRVFCAGADLSAIAANQGHLLATPEGGFAGFAHAPRIKPWIAAVKGFALGGGFELALACDMIVASDNAQFGLPEVKRGLLAGAGGIYRLPRALPRHLALEMVATGVSLEVARAVALGLVNRVAPLDRVLESALELARSIAANGPVAVRQSLRVARRAFDLAEAELRVLSDIEGKVVFDSEDAREGAGAFMQKRTPEWRGY